MKFNPLYVFSGLVVAAATTLGTLTLKPELLATPLPVVSAPAAEIKAEIKVPEAVVPAPTIAVVPETKVAIATPEPVPAPVAKIENVAPPTNPEAPSFDTVRIEPDGEAVIAGSAQPNAEVTVKRDDVVIGTATANKEGAFVLIPDQPLASGTGALSLETKINDKVVVSEDTIAVVIAPKAETQAVVALIKPDQPTKLMQAPKVADLGPAKTVQLDAVDYDAEGAIVFSGRGGAESTVRFYVDNGLVGETKADQSGKWSFAAASPIAPGQHILRADELASNGKVQSRVELPFFREEIAKVVIAPAAPVAVSPAVEPQKIGTVLASDAAVPSRIIIQPGHNLWKLSRQIYGKGKRFTVIYAANKDQIRDPAMIFPGQVFLTPTTIE